MNYISKKNIKILHGKICLLRIDLNIESPDRDLFRLNAAIPTIKFLLKNRVKIIILSHRGRPKNKDRALSLKPFQNIIVKKINQPVSFLANLPSRLEIEKNSKKRVFLVENLRFWPGEVKNSPEFAKKMAFLGDFYMNEAFAVSHRKNASINAIKRFLPSYIGLNFQSEIKHLEEVKKAKKRPFTVILGGSKIEDKLGVIKYFWRKADYFLLGGGPANTFFATQGLPIGNSIYDPKINLRSYLNNKKIILPLDTKIKNRQILDIGPETIKKYSEIIRKSRMIIWNGPMGLFEKRGFENGTKEIWRAILQNKKAKIVVGGGETIASLRLITGNYKSITKNIFLSAGGGAMLKYLSGEKLNG